MPYSDKERQKQYLKEWDLKRRIERPEYVLWKSAKRRARAKELDFNIEPTDVIIPAFCPLLNIPIIHKIGKGSADDNSPSLDRIDNRFGYIKGNILVVSWRANFLKSDAALSELQLLVANLQSITENK